jgi:hypothetical protein
MSRHIQTCYKTTCLIQPSSLQFILVELSFNSFFGRYCSDYVIKFKIVAVVKGLMDDEKGAI